MAEVTQEELSKWLEEQEKNEPNENVLKTFKWFLMKIEKADKNKDYKDIVKETLKDNPDLLVNKEILSKN